LPDYTNDYPAGCQLPAGFNFRKGGFMKVMILGGAGYIGSHVVLDFLKRGHQVTVYDNLSTGWEINVPEGVPLIKGDLLEKEKLSEAIKGHDAVVHLAALKAAGASMTEPELYSLNNITGTLNVLEAMTRCDCRYMVFSSSAAIFGEPEYIPIDEEHPRNPENYYGFTKLEIERFMEWYARLRGLRFASLRYFNAAGYDLYGRIGGLEKNPANLLPILMETVRGARPSMTIYGDDYDTPDGTCIRDYVHVSDLAEAHGMALAWLERADRGNLLLNLGSGKGISVREMVDATIRTTGRKLPHTVGPRRPGDPARLVAGSRLAYDTLGWEARHSDLETLVGSAWKAYDRKQ
jgi:UDP-glucose 4-epimerase